MRPRDFAQSMDRSAFCRQTLRRRRSQPFPPLRRVLVQWALSRRRRRSYHRRTHCKKRRGGRTKAAGRSFGAPGEVQDEERDSPTTTPLNSRRESPLTLAPSLLEKRSRILANLIPFLAAATLRICATTKERTAAAAAAARHFCTECTRLRLCPPPPAA